MIEIIATPVWQQAFPGGTIGLLEVSGIENTSPCSALDQRKAEIEMKIRDQFNGQTRQELLALPAIAAYQRYYKQFNKTYHVLLQLESVAFKEKHLPVVSPLVDSYFAAELETLILTAGHDVDKLSAPVVMDVSSDQDELTLMSGQTRQIYAGDMVMRDQHGMCCSIIYGQDNLSPITPATRHALFVSYAPAGVPVENLEQNHKSILHNIRLFSPAAVVEQSRFIRA